MKTLFFATLIALAAAGSAFAGDHYVSGYTRSNGTYVAPHYQTNPNSTTSDNYSTVGNVNPYTGAPGTKPDTRPSYAAPTFYTPPPPAPATSYTSPYAPQPKAPCTGLYC